MKLNNLTNLKRLLSVVDECEDEVMLITEEGDCLNLRSQLSKLIVLSGLFEGANIPEMEVKCKSRNDTKLLVNFMMNNR